MARTLAAQPGDVYKRQVFTAVSASGNAVFLSGNVIRQYQVSTNGAIRLGADGAGRCLLYTSRCV